MDRVAKHSDSNLALSAVIGPDPTSTEIFNRVYRNKPETGEGRLLLALLEDAIDCLGLKNSHDQRKQRLYREAVRWIERTDERPFSFVFVCEFLGCDPGFTRQQLLRKN